MRDIANIRFTIDRNGLPIILVAAVIQGWALYGLHQCIKSSSWPATDLGWLAALYSLAMFGPLTIQMLCEHAKAKALWPIVGVVLVAYFYFGWHYGRVVHAAESVRFVDSESFGSTAFIMGLLWLLILPFIQVRLSTGAWAGGYTLIFTTAWRNKLMLAEAALFTGLFWLLLALWAALFHMLGIGFFKDLFVEPIFVYPVTTLAFGIALHLIGSVERLTAAILEQLLSVLKWLAIVAGFILALFTVALVFKLPGLVFSGEKAIGAVWLLWLVAVMVLLINAAYRDGRAKRPYPGLIAVALRCVIPLTIIVSCTALYALVVRAQRYGITVERVWAFVVAGTACSYAVGYSLAAVRKGQWLGWVGRVNVMVALALIATIAATLTPVLSPYRLAANSQYRTSVAASAVERSDLNSESSLRYLRFKSGRYGVERLRELSVLQDHPEAGRLRKASLATLKLADRWESIPIEAGDIFDSLVTSPANHEIDAKLRARIVEVVSGSGINNSGFRKEGAWVGVFVDLQGDDVEEFVLLQEHGGDVYKRIGDEWELVGRAHHEYGQGSNQGSMLESVKAGNVSAEIPEWKLLHVGSVQYRVTEADAPRRR